MSDTRDGRFPETSWGLVTQAQDVDVEARSLAMSELCEIYWPPIYAFARHQGQSPADAEDLTQGFLADIVEHDKFSYADRQRGKLRTFLLSAFKRYISCERQHQTRLKRGGKTVAISLNQDLGEQHFSMISADEVTPEALFDRHWLLLLFDRTLDRLRLRYEQKNKSEHFEAFKHFLDDCENQSYEEAAQELGMTTGAIRVAVHRFLREYRELLIHEVGLTLTDGEDPESELRHLAAWRDA